MNVRRCIMRGLNSFRLKSLRIIALIHYERDRNNLFSASLLVRGLRLQIEMTFHLEAHYSDTCRFSRVARPIRQYRWTSDLSLINHSVCSFLCSGHFSESQKFSICNSDIQISCHTSTTSWRFSKDHSSIRQIKNGLLCEPNCAGNNFNN